MGILSAKTLKLCLLLQFLNSIKLAVRKQKYVFMSQLMHLVVARGAVSGILKRGGKKGEDPLSLGMMKGMWSSSSLGKRWAVMWRPLVGTVWRKGAEYLLIFLSDCIVIKINVDQSRGKNTCKLQDCHIPVQSSQRSLVLKSLGSTWKRRAFARGQVQIYVWESNQQFNQQVWLFRAWFVVNV